MYSLEVLQVFVVLSDYNQFTFGTAWQTRLTQLGLFTHQLGHRLVVTGYEQLFAREPVFGSTPAVCSELPRSIWCSWACPTVNLDHVGIVATHSIDLDVVARSIHEQGVDSVQATWGLRTGVCISSPYMTAIRGPVPIPMRPGSAPKPTLPPWPSRAPDAKIARNMASRADEWPNQNFPSCDRLCVFDNPPAH